MSARPPDHTIVMSPIGWVRGGRAEATDDDWGEEVCAIVLDDRYPPEAVAGLEDFSHLEVLYVFDRIDESTINLGARHPRGRTDWPLVGIFAQRAKARPNRIGVTVCELLEVVDRTVTVRGLDAVDGSPVLDLKPFMSEFAPRGTVRQPAWSHELMKDYWTIGGSGVSPDPQG